MYKVISYNNKYEWDKEMEQMKLKDVHYFHSYCELYYKNGDGDPCLFVFSNQKGDRICYAFLKRRIDLPFVQEELYDIITLLGFGGPLYDRADDQIIKDFRNEFENYCEKEKIVSEFTRFNPMLGNERYLEELMDLKNDREMIYIDLNNTEECIFNNYHIKHRQSIKKAVKNELEFRIFSKNEAMEQVNLFYELYKETMDRVNATPYYYFSLDYFKNFLTGLYNNSILAAVFLKGNMIAAAVCMYEGGFLHYHLACSKKDYVHLGANIFLVHKIALWGKKNSCHSFFLGGGHVGRDTLFKFKHRFNLQGNLHFYVGKKIHLPDKYFELIDQWEKYYSQAASKTFFPAYRPVSRATPRPLVK